MAKNGDVAYTLENTVIVCNMSYHFTRFPLQCKSPLSQFENIMNSPDDHVSRHETYVAINLILPFLHLLCMQTIGYVHVFQPGIWNTCICAEPRVLVYVLLLEPIELVHAVLRNTVYAS